MKWNNIKYSATLEMYYNILMKFIYYFWSTIITNFYHIKQYYLNGNKFNWLLFWLSLVAKNSDLQ